jgi:hypothetical protein
MFFLLVQVDGLAMRQVPLLQDETVMESNGD